VANGGWKRRFDDAIALLRGRQLVTLEDAGRYITRLPKAEYEAAQWQAAMEALILVATSGGPTMFARIGVVLGGLNVHAYPDNNVTYLDIPSPPCQLKFMNADFDGCKRFAGITSCTP
jgi:hypothetical protein